MKHSAVRSPIPNIILIAALFVGSFAALGTVGNVRADHTPDPSSVTIAGSLQQELGCTGDWQPDCAGTHLTYDANDEVWQGTFAVPAGNWEYKAPVNDSWDENYGLHAVQGGDNIPLNLGGATSVKFYYDHKTHWVTDNQNSVIAVAPGSFQSELGCSGDWDPGCLQSWLQDTDGDGTIGETEDIATKIVDKGAGNDVVLYLGNGGTVTFKGIGTGTINEISDLVADPTTQLFYN